MTIRRLRLELTRAALAALMREAVRRLLRWLLDDAD
jgi:hypothetical protein